MENREGSDVFGLTRRVCADTPAEITGRIQQHGGMPITRIET
jgi:hypothetical protein